MQHSIETVDWKIEDISMIHKFLNLKKLKIYAMNPHKFNVRIKASNRLFLPIVF